VKNELLQRYFANQVTPEEESLVISWIDDPANQAALLAYMEAGYKQEKETAPVAPFEVLFKEALHRESHTAKLAPMRNRKWLLTGAAAACVLFMALGGWIGYHMRSDKEEVRHTWVLNNKQEGTQQHTRVLLSDGSEVYLNADSKLTIEKEMNISPVVYLEGAASFNLRKEGNGVTIKTKGMVTKAKDSRLNISAFPKDSTETVTVQKGLAEVISNDRIFPLVKLRPAKQDSAQLAKAAEEERMKKAFMPLRLIRPVVVKANESVTFEKSNKTDAGERERAKGASDSVE
jgi:ferric-dicitrate binding protein FerR (iron transport regulator)